VTSHRFTDARDGDLAIGGEPDALAARRRELFDGPWTWLRQVHGAEVVVVDEPAPHAGASADAAITTVPGVVLAVHTADCASLLLQGPGGIGVVHAGWRGLVAGVIEAAVEALEARGARPRSAVLGPCIRPRCYEFGGAELDLVAERYGDRVRATTAWGTPALDLAAGVVEACHRLDVAVDDLGTCTACSPHHFSHRARADVGRQALVARCDR
jgi:YfiH family protein